MATGREVASPADATTKLEGMTMTTADDADFPGIDMTRICVSLGGRMRVIPMAVFQDAHDELAEFYRAQGLSGDELDLAISKRLPHRLTELINGSGKIFH